MKFKLATWLATILLLLACTVNAAEFKAAVVYGSSSKFDKSFSQSAFEGAERFRKETGIDYFEIERTSLSQREEAMRKLASEGADIIVALGFYYAAIIKKLAKEFPDTKFTIIDSVVDLPNVRSVTFKENEGSFLVGMAAALTTKSGTIGFIGGRDVPVIRNFGLGYLQGANYVNPDIQILYDTIGTTNLAWNNPDKGYELANFQFEEGADVVFAAAGGSGAGVFKAAKEADKFAIGVDSNQNYLQPGTILTSMVKHVDVAVYHAFMDAKNGSWSSGLQVMGLADDGVGWAIDEHNQNLISDEILLKIEEAKADIINGKIIVQSYQ